MRRATKTPNNKNVNPTEIFFQNNAKPADYGEIGVGVGIAIAEKTMLRAGT